MKLKILVCTNNFGCTNNFFEQKEVLRETDKFFKILSHSQREMPEVSEKLF